MNHTRKDHRGAEGFSLLELMIVIAVIGILIGVSVSGWRAMVRSANEAAAITSMRSIAERQMLYYNSHRRTTFGTFAEMRRDNLVDNRYDGTAPVVEGYIFTLRVIPRSTSQPASYTLNADPQVTEGISATGKNHYYLDADTNTIHVNESQPATASDPSIGG